MTVSLVNAAPKPNIVLIFIDDMGYGDIGPFGNTVNKTPELDRMAKEGMVLTDFYVSNTACTPSRAALMTGCYADRVGMDGRVVFPGDARGLNPQEITIADMLKAEGYATACFGKWHLGDQPEFMPLAQGFDEYAGIPYSNDMWPFLRSVKCPPLPYIKGNKAVAHIPDGPSQALLCKAATDEAVDFIKRHKAQPFFLYVPHSYIHNPRFARNALFEKAEGNATRAQIEEVDWSTGQILKTIREGGLSEKTLVIFMSDNGGAGGTAKGKLRGGKGGPKYEGHMRTPTVAWWPGTIGAGTVNSEIATTIDLLPTFAKLAGAEVPADRVIDGDDVSDLLLKPGAKSPHDVLYYEYDGIRRGPWKLVRVGMRAELYDLDDDIGEKKNVADEHPDRVKELTALLDKHMKLVQSAQRPAAFVENPKPFIAFGSTGGVPTLVDYFGLPAFEVGGVAPRKPVQTTKSPAKPTAATVFKADPSDILIADFEGKAYGDWKVAGEAFGKRPAIGNVTPRNRVTGYMGKGLVNSFINGDKSTGTLTSPEFTIERKRINFLVGAGRHKGKTCMNLLIAGKPVRTAAGCARKDAQKNEIMLWHSWDVAEFSGKEAVLQIVDSHTGGWGHINIDHIVQSDRVVKGAVMQKGAPANKKPEAATLLQGADRVIGEREIEIKGKYLLVPVSKTITTCAFRGHDRAMQEQLDVFVDGVLVHSPSVDLAHSEDDISFWGQLDMSEYVGKRVRLRMWVLNSKAKRAIPADTEALAMVDSGDQPRGKNPLYKESLRPQLRFSQMRGWNNDSNGMLYYGGEYHLFWQANPVGLGHANMYWGHAVSTDLLHWKELPEALRPFAQDAEKIHPAIAIGHCHSGGGAVDFNNTGGWQTGDDKVLLLTFTDTGKKSGRARDLPGFTESIAYSADKGRTWKIWEGNPIIRHVGRDPKLFWYPKGKHWSIAVYDEDQSGRGIAFHKSTDLKKWERTGKLGGFFECPEVFHAPVIGADGKKRWAMFGGDGQYVVGDFNGKTFVPEHEGKHRFIYGNVYAGQCFSDAPDGRVIYIGWARGLRLPGMPFSQGFTLPIEFTLHETPDGVRMRGYPVKEFDSLRSKELFTVSDRKLAAGEAITFETDEDLADIELTVKPAPGAEKLVLAFGDVTVGYDFKTGKAIGLPMKRGKGQESAPLQLEGGKLQIRLVVDRPMCEVFFNAGEVYALIPKVGGKIGKLTLETEGTVEELNVYGMKSIWD